MTKEQILYEKVTSRKIKKKQNNNSAEKNFTAINLKIRNLNIKKKRINFQVCKIYFKKNSQDKLPNFRN